MNFGLRNVYAWKMHAYSSIYHVDDMDNVRHKKCYEGCMIVYIRMHDRDIDYWQVSLSGSPLLY